MNILNPRFKYRPSAETDLRETFRKHGFRATTQAERDARQKRLHDEAPKNVTPISKRAKGAK